VLPQDLVASATLRYLGTSAQKARLVVDLIRGRDVGEAISTLRFTKKAVASEIAGLLNSAVANAHQKRQDIDVDRLFVRTAFVDGGPSMKRIQPAPMGRAFRILKRMCHVTIGLGERKEAVPATRRAAGEGAKAAAGAASGVQAARARRVAGGGAKAPGKAPVKAAAGGRAGRGRGGGKDRA
jgi:large subunit ribosomal protein L22